MNDKKLIKLSKKELLEIILIQLERIEALEKELGKTKKELENKKIKIKESGSLAEAALKLNNIFEVAQQTADQYLEQIKEKNQLLDNKIKSKKNGKKKNTKKVKK